MYDDTIIPNYVVYKTYRRTSALDKQYPRAQSPPGRQVVLLWLQPRRERRGSVPSEDSREDPTLALGSDICEVPATWGPHAAHFQRFSRRRLRSRRHGMYAAYT